MIAIKYPYLYRDVDRRGNARYYFCAKDSAKFGFASNQAPKNLSRDITSFCRPASRKDSTRCRAKSLKH